MASDLRVLLVITRGERGGAQVHVRDLVAGLQHETEGQAGVVVEVVVGEGGFLADALAALGVVVHVEPVLQRAVHPLRDLAAVRMLRRHVRRFGPHLVHTHSTKAGLVGRLAGWSLGVPVLHTAHAWSFSDGLSWQRRAMAIPLEVAAGRITTHVIGVSEADRRLALKWHVVPHERVSVVHNGVGDVPQRARAGADEVPVVVMVARLAPPKDPVLLIDALAGISEPWKLRIVGDGPLRADVEAAVARHGLADRVSLLGVRSDVPDQLAQGHIFVLASKQEGFPLAILEAMRAGLPVVASDVGGVAEAVVHDQTGALVARGQVELLREALRCRLTDPERRAREGAAGRAAFEARFAVPQMVRQTLNIYRSTALSSKKTSQSASLAGANP